MWSIKATTLSAAKGAACRPAAANNGAAWRGMEHWDAFRTKSSDHTSLKSATWSVTYYRKVQGWIVLKVIYNDVSYNDEY